MRLNEVSQLEMDVDRDMLQRHAVTVMEGLGAAVESLEDSDFLNSVLISIGQTHVRRNVKPQMLKVRSWNTSTSSLDFIRCHENALELYPFSSKHAGTLSIFTKTRLDFISFLENTLGLYPFLRKHAGTLSIIKKTRGDFTHYYESIVICYPFS